MDGLTSRAGSCRVARSHAVLSFGFTVRCNTVYTIKFTSIWTGALAAPGTDGARGESWGPARSTVQGGNAGGLGGVKNMDHQSSFCPVQAVPWRLAGPDSVRPVCHGPVLDRFGAGLITWPATRHTVLPSRILMPPTAEMLMGRHARPDHIHPFGMDAVGSVGTEAFSSGLSGMASLRGLARSKTQSEVWSIIPFMGMYGDCLDKSQKAGCSRHGS